MTRLLLLGLLAALPLAACDSGSDAPAAPAGAAYVMSNEATNRVVAYARAADGALSRIGSYETGGAGSAGRIVPALDQVVVDPLFSNDALILSPDRSRLFVANPGSGTVTSFRVEADFSLTRVGTASSGGTVSAYGLVDGQLSLLNAVAAQAAPMGGVDFMGTPSSGPSDTYVTPEGRFLYQQWTGRGTVSAYTIGTDGGLTLVGEYGMGDMPTVGAEGF